MHKILLLKIYSLLKEESEVWRDIVLSTLPNSYLTESYNKIRYSCPMKNATPRSDYQTVNLFQNAHSVVPRKEDLSESLKPILNILSIMDKIKVNILYRNDLSLNICWIQL